MASPAVEKSYTVPDATEGLPDTPISPGKVKPITGRRVTFRIWTGQGDGAKFTDYTTEVTEGMVVLDAVHQIQAETAPTLACRWNCKAGKCGSCSAEINGKPRLMCMTRLDTLDLDQPVIVEPMKSFPHVKDLVTD